MRMSRPSTNRISPDSILAIIAYYGGSDIFRRSYMQSKEQPTPYVELDAVLHELVASIRQAVGNDFIGAYLQGSFAVGDFDEHSHPDFVVAIRNEFSEAQVAELQRVHERIYGLESEWARPLEGSYFPAAMLRRGERCGEPLWYLDHGSNRLIKSNHCNTLV